ncbi:MAG: hypothetical protein WAS07_10525 [Micropruina sp.]|nr:hypothetical protein [Micropruina sp.]
MMWRKFAGSTCLVLAVFAAFGAAPIAAAEPSGQRDVSEAIAAARTAGRDVEATSLRTPTMTVMATPHGATYAYLRAVAMTELWSIGQAFPDGWNEEVFVGKNFHGRPFASRLFYRFDLGWIPPQGIANAQFLHSQLRSPNRECHLDSYGPAVAVAATEPFTSTTTWPGPDALASDAVSGYAHGASCGPIRDQVWDVTTGVIEARLTSSEVTLGMRSTDETDKRGYRGYVQPTGAGGQHATPELLVHFDVAPSVDSLTITPLASSGGAGLVTGSDTPTLHATVRGPGGCPGTTALTFCLSAQFELLAGGAVVFSGPMNQGREINGTLEFDAGLELVEGTEYTARVQAVNSSSGLTSDMAEVVLRYDAPPPAPEARLVGDPGLGQPILIEAVSHAPDVSKLCWVSPGGAVNPDGVCTATQPGVPMIVIAGTNEGQLWLNLGVYAVDSSGTAGRQTIIQAALTPW